MYVWCFAALLIKIFFGLIIFVILPLMKANCENLEGSNLEWSDCILVVLVQDPIVVLAKLSLKRKLLKVKISMELPY